MHELSIAQSILETVSELAQKNKLKRVTAIYISLGVLSGVEKESLLYSFDLLPKTAPLTNTKLIVSEGALTIFCEHCQKESVVLGSYVLKCAQCGQRCSKITKGKELTIDTIEY